MKNLEIQNPTTHPNSRIFQTVYVLDNGGARIKKFVCRLSEGENIDDTIAKAKNYIDVKGIKIRKVYKFNID